MSDIFKDFPPTVTITGTSPISATTRAQILADTREYVKRHRVGHKPVERYLVRDEKVAEPILIEQTPEEHFNAVYDAFLSIYTKAQR